MKLLKKIINEGFVNNLFAIIGSISIVLFVFEFKAADNVFYKWVLMAVLLLFGFIFEFFLGLLIEKLFPNLQYKIKRKTSIGFGLLVGGIIFFFPTIGNYYNKTFYSNSNCNNYIITSKIERYKYRARIAPSYYIQVNNNCNPLEIEIDAFDFERISSHAKVEVCIATGGLGFDLVSHIYYH